MAQPWEAVQDCLGKVHLYRAVTWRKACHSGSMLFPLKFSKMYSITLFDCPNLLIYWFFQRNCPQAQGCNHKHYQETCPIQNGTRNLDSCSHSQVWKKPSLGMTHTIIAIMYGDGGQWHHFPCVSSMICLDYIRCPVLGHGHFRCSIIHRFLRVMAWRIRAMDLMLVL